MNWDKEVSSPEECRKNIHSSKFSFRCLEFIMDGNTDSSYSNLLCVGSNFHVENIPEFDYLLERTRLRNVSWIVLLVLFGSESGLSDFQNHVDVNKSLNREWLRNPVPRN